MSLFSFLRKNKQESASGESTFQSRAEEDSKAVRSRAKRRGKDSREDDALDPVLPEKKRARRRLIGAVALVLAAVVGLPMVLDSEPKPLADDIAIQIPSKDKPVAGAAARADMPAASKVAASASLDAKEEVVEAPAAPASAEKKPEQPAAEQHKPKDDAKASTDSGHKAADKAAVVAKAEPKSTESHDKTDDSARAKALLEGKPDPKAAEKKAGKFVIQVAALATKDKVDELQGKLKGAGIKSYTEKIATASGDRTRIRVGPFTSKEDAEKARAKIVKLGLNGTLVPA
ncbi:SPOR domain-containing protein [Noviherbaspirillum denitrificans]|uniref:SPOR domain-containing protein n=1 Tax=Noviherbaspirillum denitrificans TaxID=1968433 RepID=A0A254TCF4_9BURK|nr:SPOR domain-containing protein [Noviherbaspirillum denitrificans]OWW18972.1 hypothetical protein AYR66_05205 [Noviherbaspirillum denitrificans]